MAKGPSQPGNSYPTSSIQAWVTVAIYSRRLDHNWRKFRPLNKWIKTRRSQCQSFIVSFTGIGRLYGGFALFEWIWSTVSIIDASAKTEKLHNLTSHWLGVAFDSNLNKWFSCKSRNSNYHRLCDLINISSVACGWIDIVPVMNGSLFLKVWRCSVAVSKSWLAIPSRNTSLPV